MYMYTGELKPSEDFDGVDRPTYMLQAFVIGSFKFHYLLVSGLIQPTTNW